MVTLGKGRLGKVSEQGRMRFAAFDFASGQQYGWVLEEGEWGSIELKGHLGSASPRTPHEEAAILRVPSTRPPHPP